MPKILNKEVGPIGYGLMGLTGGREPGSLPDEEAFKAMKAALNNGCNFWNGGEFYGRPENNSLQLLKRYFTKYPEDAEKVVISIKATQGCASVATFPPTPQVDEAGVRKSIDSCLSALDGTKFIDIFEPARLDPKTPVEETISALAAYVKAGKIGGIMLSEVKAETIRRAHKVHPIAGVELELSLWATDPMKSGVAETCAELGIPIIAYSPVGRGMLTGTLKTIDDLPKDDRRRHWPRFQPGSFEINIKLAQAAQNLASQKGCTPAQFAISWAQSRTGRPAGLVSIPIPGASSEARVNENSKLIEWTDRDEEEVNKILAEFEVVGDRYPEHLKQYCDL